MAYLNLGGWKTQTYDTVSVFPIIAGLFPYRWMA